MRNSFLPVAVLALLMLVALAACGGSEALIQRAGSFEGGALSVFGGTDGADSAARDTARGIAANRSYDFTPTGFDLLAGAATGWFDTPSIDYGEANGTLAISGDEATVDLDVISNDPNVSEVAMAGTFSVSDAQAAIQNPGSSFTVDWTITWLAGGEPRSLTAQQTLLGSDWQNI